MNEAILEQVKQKIEEVFPAVVAFRRDLHEHPELSGHEDRTSRRIAEELRNWVFLTGSRRKRPSWGRSPARALRLQVNTQD